MEIQVSAPRLLVSVRSPEEAMAAVTGGAAIIDIKEPLNGPLGMAPADVCCAIADSLQQLPSSPPLSLALGELRDWQQRPSGTASVDNSLDFTASLPGLRWLKCGLAGYRENPNWISSWRQFRDSLPARSGWVAVAYADAERAAAPDISEVLQAALEIRAAALLIDTFVKDDTNLFDWLSPDELQGICVETQAARVPLALAGRLTLDDVPQLLRIGPEIIAVRGAACVGNQRVACVSTERVRTLVERLAGPTF
jgi:uncharacterized protein (UPF0264 family)